MFYNVDLFKEAGLPEEGPQTWEQVYEYSQIINEKTGKYGCYIEDDNWGAQALLESNGAEFITADKDGKMHTNIASEGGIEAMQMWADMIAQGLTPHITWDEGCQAFNAGEVAMLYTTIARRASIQSTAQFEAAAVNSPVWEGKERIIPAGGCFLAITALKEEEQKAATTQMDGVVSWASFPGNVGLEADQILSDAQDQILGGSISAQDKINTLLGY